MHLLGFLCAGNLLLVCAAACLSLSKDDKARNACGCGPCTNAHVHERKLRCVGYRGSCLPCKRRRLLIVAGCKLVPALAKQVIGLGHVAPLTRSLFYFCARIADCLL